MAYCEKLLHYFFVMWRDFCIFVVTNPIILFAIKHIAIHWSEQLQLKSYNYEIYPIEHHSEQPSFDAL